MPPRPGPSPAEVSPYRDSPARIFPATVGLIDGVVDPAGALDVARAVVPAWASVSEARVRPVSGGITNGLTRLSAPGRSDVLVRVYGPRTEVVIDRERENRLFARLSRAGFAPPYLGRFENGRVEGFLDGFSALEPHEMGDDAHRPGIARRLAELHGYAPTHAVPRTFATLRAWLQRALELRFDGPSAEAHAALELPQVVERLDRLEAHFHGVLHPGASSAGARAAVRPVLAHNDLLSGNILVHAASGEVRFIDYEYGDCGFAAFDVANHFCEYAGFDSDFAAGFPTEDVRRDFIGHYLGPSPSRTDVADFERLVRFFVLVDHLWWGSWAVVQARYSPIDFDFMGYAALRLAGLDFHSDQWGPLARK